MSTGDQLSVPDEHEVRLQGGNASGVVVRVGDTVRKPWSPTTPAVVDFMFAMRESGIDVPAPLGMDDRGRQVMEFVPGQSAMEALPLDDAELARVGHMIRELHDAADHYEPHEPFGEVLIPAPPGPPVLICHHDLAPWNLLIGERWVFIDWDGAGPSTRVWDLSYAAHAFALTETNVPPKQAAARLAAFIDGYGADDDLRAQLPAMITARTQAMYDLLADASVSGRQPWASMYAEGHGQYWQDAAEYVKRHQQVWSNALQRKTSS